MSVKAISWAFEQELSPTPMLVLVALADWADEDGYCFPSHDRLLTRVHVSRRTLVSILKKLEEDGFFVRERRTREGGVRTSDGYWLSMTVIRQGANSARATDDILNMQTVAPTEAIRKEPSEEPSVVNARVRTREVDALLDHYFEAFWKNYPRKVGKVAARAAYMAAIKRKVSPFAIAEGLDRHLPDLSSRDPQYIPHASTWLNGERYNDEVTAPHRPAPTQGHSKPTPMERYQQILNLKPPTERDDR